MKPDLRLGRYQDVLQDVVCDALICDPPYSNKTHAGRRTGSEIRSSGIQYDFITRDDAFELAEFMRDRVRWWVVIFADHVTREWHAEAWEAAGWYVFGPVRWVKPNSAPRMSGDGPTTSTEDIVIARPKIRLPKERAGSRPGHYIYRTETGGNVNVITGKTYPGRKPLGLMKAIIMDYTIEGDIVCDSYAGTGATLKAAAQLKRRAIGCDKEKSVYQTATTNLSMNNNVDILDARKTTDMFFVA